MGRPILAAVGHAPHPAPPRARGPASLAAAGVAPLVAMGGRVGGSADKLPRQAVPGNVTMNGKPPERGVISSSPDVQATGPVTGGGVIAEHAPGEGPGGPPRATSESAPSDPARSAAPFTFEAEVKTGGATALGFAPTTK